MRVTIAVNVLIMMILSTVNLGFSHLYNMDPCTNTCSQADQSQECLCRTYTFAFMIYRPWTFLNSTTGDAYGPAVEVVDKVCETAGKLCKFAAVDMPACWDGMSSNVLNGRWYDACVGSPAQPQMVAKYDFVENGISLISKPVIWARTDSNITEEVLRSPHDFRLGFFNIRIPTFDNMIDSYLNDGFFIKEKNIIRLDGDLDSIAQQLTSALECGSGGNSIDILYMSPTLLPPGNFTYIAEVDHNFGDYNIMVRYDEQCFLKWYNEAYEKFICSDEYPTFCKELTESQGNVIDFCRDRNAICS